MRQGKCSYQESNYTTIQCENIIFMILNYLLYSSFYVIVNTLSPRMARATILRPRSASPRTRSFSFGRDESEAADHEYNNLWEKRSSSPGIIEYLSDRSVTKSPKVNPKKDQSLSKLDTEKVENEIGNEKETTLSAEARSVEDSPQTTSQPHTPPPDPEELLTLCKAKNTSVSSTIGDEFFFDERDFYEISDMESDTSLDEFELRFVPFHSNF